MMLRGLWKLTWIEIKIFLREPLGAFGTIVFPVLIFIGVGSSCQAADSAPSRSLPAAFSASDLPVLVSLLIAISAVLSLVTIISIYREGGILKRLRATPLRPQTILTAHVIVKLVLTAATLALMVLAGKRYYPVGVHVPLFSFTIALLISTWSILSIGFLIASIVPTARFAQPIGAVILYPMIALSGLFVPRCNRCRQCCTRWRACCRSPTPCRCSRESGTATRGRPTWATSRRWPWCLSSARRSRRRYFAGSSNSASSRLHFPD